MTTDNTTPERLVVAATRAAEATVINTDTEGIDTSRIEIAVEGFGVQAYAARPTTGADLPVIIVIGEAFGLHPYLEDVVRRFAKLGYLAVAPDLMARQGNPDDFDDVEALVTDLLQKVSDRQVMTDLDATVDWAITHGGDPHRVGTSGFSWGGRWAWLFAAHSSRIAASVSWYGVVDDSGSRLQPDHDLFPRHPIDLVEELRTPVLGLYAGRDAVIPIATVESMRAALLARPDATPQVDFMVYDEAVHGFFADYRDDYDPIAAPDSWSHALAWLKKHGV